MRNRFDHIASKSKQIPSKSRKFVWKRSKSRGRTQKPSRALPLTSVEELERPPDHWNSIYSVLSWTFSLTEYPPATSFCWRVRAPSGPSELELLSKHHSDSSWTFVQNKLDSFSGIEVCYEGPFPEILNFHISECMGSRTVAIIICGVHLYTGIEDRRSAKE